MCCSEVNRRTFLERGAAGMGAAFAAVHAGDISGSGGAKRAPADAWNPWKPLLRHGKELRVQPVLLYRTPERREQTSWKSWGGVLTDEAAFLEMRKIAGELEMLRLIADFPVAFLPVISAQSVEEVSKVKSGEHDVRIIYPAAGGGDMLRAAFAGESDILIFVRHRSGPVYYWYEALSVRYLGTGSDPEGKSDKSPHVDDVVVDDPGELLWRLRALYGAANMLSERIVALGGAWGKYSAEAPQTARSAFNMNIIEIPYADVAERIQTAVRDRAMLAAADEWTAEYLALPGTALKTEKPFVRNSFVLYSVFKELMAEHNAHAFTIKDCMGVIMPLAETTACLTLTFLNDEGYAAFCESDFVIIPAGLLLRHLSGKPVFLHNSTFPHNGIVTCAHCSAPRRMDGARYEPVQIMTHYESEYGAAPKVEIPAGQEVCFINPEYSVGRWIGFKGVVRDNPFLDICRSQQDVEIAGDWRKLIREVRDSHWVMVYGDYLKEAQYAARKIGVRFETI